VILDGRIFDPTSGTFCSAVRSCLNPESNWLQQAKVDKFYSVLKGALFHDTVESESFRLAIYIMLMKADTPFASVLQK